MNYATDRILHELDNWTAHLEYFSTAWGGSPDPEGVALCEAKIAELNEALSDSQDCWPGVEEQRFWATV